MKNENKKNVSDYETIKNIIMSEYYDLLRLVNTLNDPRMREGSTKYTKLLKRIDNRIFFLANVAGSSKNITKKMYNKMKDFDLEGTYKQEVLDNLKNLMYDLSEDMGETGFLDTRLFDDKETEVSEDLENFYLDKKPAIYDR